MTDTATYIPEAPPAPQEPYAGSLPKRVVDTFISPIALFQRFGSRPPWVDVMILSVVLSLLVLYLTPSDVLVATVEETMRQRGQQMPAGADPQSMVGMQRIFGTIFGAVTPWIILVIYAGVMTLIFNVVMGGRARFRQYVSVVAHSFLIYALGQLVYLPIAIQQGVMSPGGLSLGVLAAGMDHDSFVYQFLNYLNVFGLWQAVVMGLGAATLNRRIGAGTAVAVMLALSAAFAAIFAAAF